MTLKSYAERNDIKEYGINFTRKKWIQNWRQKVYWGMYFDLDMVEVEDTVRQYCQDNRIDFEVDGGWLYCVSDRRQYNDIVRIIDELLCYRDEEFE